ncbi:HutD family protein [Tissierella sp. MSJ-40]|uniref:HutD family protein n=1 Tax=Tissierella simiarum TaxID=2841534 RepID=A0ABS6E4R0_9FIRM|nr:HutD family protein [Tissierella simiarum]MBU5437243.1 HutD family protein [Tissierella simiarum]
MKITTKLIKEDDYITTEWSGGKTTQLFIYPEDSNYKDFNFKFRLSSATVELERSEFTKLEGVYRFITPLDKGFKLTHNHKDYISLRPFEIYEFDGDIDTVSYGTVRDFNLMLGNGARGKLENIYINREHLLIEECSSDFKETFYFIYAYNDKIHINIDGDIKIIRPLQILLIKLNSNTVLNLKITSENPTNILIAKIYM